MNLRYLKAKNFLSHEEEEIIFPDQGLFLLSGESGFGKSSFIVDATAFALFGANATRAKKQIELLHKDHPGESMEVTAMFEFDDNRRFTVSRGLDKKGGPFAQVYKPSSRDEEAVLLEEGSQPVNKFIKKELGGMNYRQFYAAFVARQSEIALLTSLRGAQRKERIHEMLGMKELEKAAEIVTARLRRTNAEINQLQNQIGGKTEQEEKEKIELEKEELKENKQRLKETEIEEKDLLEERNKIKKIIVPLVEEKENREQNKEYQISLMELESQKTILEEKDKKSSLAKSAQEDIQSLQEAKKKLETTTENLRQEFVVAKDYLSKEKEIEEIKESLLAYKHVDELEKVQHEVDKNQSEKEFISKEKETRKKEKQKIEKEGMCFVCLRPLQEDSDHNVISEIDKKITSLEEKETKINVFLENSQELLQKAKEKNDLQRKKEIIENQQAEKNVDHVRSLEVIKEEGQKASQEIEELATKLARSQTLQEDYDPLLKDKLKKLTLKIKEIEEQKKPEQDLDIENLDSLQKEDLELKSAIQILQGRKPELQRSVLTQEKRIKDMENELKGIQHELKSLSELKEKALLIERLQAYIRGYQRQLAEEIRPSLEEIGSEMIYQVSNGRHTKMSIDGDYEIEVETKEGSWVKASMLSGGEEIRANICLRLALTRLVSQRTGVPVRFLVLDEPLPAQDEGHIERILELLETLRPFYPQQFIISHVGSLKTEDQVDYILEFASQNGINRATLFNA